MRKLACLVAVPAFLAGSVFATSARAEASAWAFLGGGGLAWKQFQNPAYAPAGTLTVDGGVGSSPDGKVIVGGVFRIQGIFHSGVDLSLLARLATHGFQAGDWGVAFDAGGFARPWGNQSVGFAGSVSLGMPLGITLMAQTEAGIDHAFAFGGALGIDLLRLTVYRQTLLKWWQNPSPAWSQTAARGPGLTF